MYIHKTNVLDEPLPPKSEVNHNLRKRRHDRRSNVACKERTSLLKTCEQRNLLKCIVFVAQFTPYYYLISLYPILYCPSGFLANKFSFH